MNYVTYLPDHVSAEYGLRNSTAKNRWLPKVTIARLTRRWRIVRFVLRYASFTLFDAAVVALMIGLDGDLDTNTQITLILRLAAVVFYGAIVTATISSAIDSDAHAQAEKCNVYALPLLTRAALLDFWDTALGSLTAEAATSGVVAIVSQRLASGELETLYAYSKDLLCLL